MPLPFRAVLRFVKPLPEGCTLIEDVHVTFTVEPRRADSIARGAARELSRQRGRRFFLAGPPTVELEA